MPRLLHSCLVILTALVLAPAALRGDPRPPDALDAAQMRLALQRLQVVGTALYIAAHPDDENTAAITWLANGRKVRTAYLSLTRGDGGQNLIGSELGPELGVIRTQELLAARRVDGGEQRFTRAVDFGFSKNADESLEIWERDSVLADMVWVIRRLQPDVLINRFPPDSNAGHGHHSASAILAAEAFRAAADPARFPEQLRQVRPWQAKRLVWNAFVRPGVRVDSTWLRVDLGAYDPLLGRSYSEFAGVSRSFHKSQGFGAAERRGALPNVFAPVAGEPARADLFEGVELSWKRFAGGERVAAALAEAERRFDPARPQAILPILARAHAALLALPQGEPLVAARRAELEQVMASCAGLWLEAVALRPSVTPGGSVRVVTSALSRSDADVRLEAVTLGGRSVGTMRALTYNRAIEDTFALEVPADASPTQPSWLRAPGTRGLFALTDPEAIGRPEDPAAYEARFRLRIAGTVIEFARGVAHRWVDRVQGERWSTLEVAPPATLKLDEEAYLFADAAPRTIRVRVTAQRAGVEGQVTLQLPPGWSSEPATAALSLAREGAEQTVSFRVTPASGPASGTVRARIRVGERDWDHARVRIDHAHIPVQVLFPPAESRLVRTSLLRRGERVAYLMGSGDAGAAALRQMGYQVTLLTDDEVESSDLSRFHAIVTGVRAYNTRPRLGALQPRLLQYVEAGGTLVVQYVTTDGPVDALGPHPLRISRDRVTVEEAPVRLPDPAHPLLARPNAIGSADFEGWVQERGLYFARPFDPRYSAVLSSADPGEPARDGGLLYTVHGKGVFVYCGYSMFRQLPAGVPGAWRLFANLVSAKP